MAIIPSDLTVSSVIVGTAALSVAFFVLRALVLAFTAPDRHIPGPFYTRFTRLPLKRAIMSGQRIFFIDALHKKYGPVVRIAPGEVAVCNLEDFQKIHKIGSGFLKSIWYQKLANFPKAGVFTMTDPKEHGPRRKLLSRPFSRSFLVEHWEPIVREKVELCISQIKKDATNGCADVFKWWMLLASDVSAHAAFGESFNMLRTGEKTQYLRVLQKLTIGAGISVELPIFRLLRFAPVASIREVFNANQYLIEGADKAVQMAKDRHGQQANIFARVLDEAEKEGEGFDSMDVRVEALNIIIAGTDTTGVTLTYLTWAVLQRPELRKELEAEVAALPEGFNENDLQALPLLNAVIEETLRLYGAAPSSLPRVVPAGGSTMSGHYLPAGTTVSTQAWTIHRDPKIYPNPLEFNPQRWIPYADVSKEAKTAFHAFGAGARSCIGIHLARMELRYAVAFLFRECRGLKLHPNTTPESMAIQNFFLIAPKAHKCEVTL